MCASIILSNTLEWLKRYVFIASSRHRRRCRACEHYKAIQERDSQTRALLLFDALAYPCCIKNQQCYSMHRALTASLPFDWKTREMVALAFRRIIIMIIIINCASRIERHCHSYHWHWLWHIRRSRLSFQTNAKDSADWFVPWCMLNQFKYKWILIYCLFCFQFSSLKIATMCRNRSLVRKQIQFYSV